MQLKEQNTHIFGINIQKAFDYQLFCNNLQFDD